MSTPKIVNFPHFLDSRSWEKTCIYIYINMCNVFTWFCYIWRVVVPFRQHPSQHFFSRSWEKKHVNTKVQFSPLDSRSWEKTCQHQNWSILPIFGFEKKHVYISIYIHIIVYIYICTSILQGFCFIWRVVYISYIPSTPKCMFPFFWIPGVEKKHVNTKTSQFSPFLDSRNWEKTCIYI